MNRTAGLTVVVLALLRCAACTGSVETPRDAGTDGADTVEPSACRQFTSRDACCAGFHGDDACAWLKIEDGFPGACIHLPSEDCVREGNECPPGQRCYTQRWSYNGECVPWYDNLTDMGVCVDE